MPPDTERELLLQYRPWLRVVAQEQCFRYLGHCRDAEDIAQDGWIALWQATIQNNGTAPLDWWLKMRARSRMSHVLKSRIAACRDARRTVITEAAPGDQGDRYGAWARLAADNFDVVETTYFREEITAAINSLSRGQRSYVERRFWHGWTTDALDVYFGNSYKVWKPARDILAEQLAHLR